jgi:hypothetical protein
MNPSANFLSDFTITIQYMSMRVRIRSRRVIVDELLLLAFGMKRAYLTILCVKEVSGSFDPCDINKIVRPWIRYVSIVLLCWV